MTKDYMRVYREKNKKLCQVCEVNMILRESKSCKPCHYKAKMLVNKDSPLSELMYLKHHKSSAYALVRSRARAAYPTGPCEHCGYTKHTEICHIKPISSFSVDTLISVVNNNSNLIRLCPNCHWELDNTMNLTPIKE